MGQGTGVRIHPLKWVVLLSTALIVGVIPPSFAQENNAAQETTATGGAEGQGLTVGGWLVYPQIFAGAVYDDNFDQSATGTDRNSGTSLRVVPRVVANYDGGIHKTSLYGVVDAKFFNPDTLAATAGITHGYQPMQDVTFNFFGNYTRETDIFNSALQFNNGAIGPTSTATTNIPIIINPFGTTPSVDPITYNQFTGGASVTKAFDQAFASLGATAFYIAFDHPDNIPDPFHVTHDGTNIWLSGRVGYHFVPGVYAFAEADGILQRFNDSLFNTNGYRVIGGVGEDDPNSLFRGEVYGGYQTQQGEHQDEIGSGIPSDVSSGVFGGRLSYYPTRFWTLTATVDETLGNSTVVTSTIPAGTPTLVTTAILQTNYKLAREWSVGARVGYTRADYYGVDRLDNGWMAGASFNYEIWRNLHLTLDYQYSTVQSNAASSDFARNVYTAGLTYSY